ncbi:MAG: ATP-binding protein [Bacteroidia bacterium]
MTEEEEIMKSHDAFWQGYAARDLDRRFSVCADDVTFFGTGIHERAVGKKQYREMNETGIKQYPYPFDIKILWKYVRIFGDIAWVECDAEWVQGTGNKKSADIIRQTTIFKSEDHLWKVKHVHGSEPDYRLKAGEYMIDRTIADRNRELERQVFERTKELEDEKKRSEQKSLELEQTLFNLRITQKQLIHSEKMASLGLLTSGIAHELKNPLNFINNFAKLSKELMVEYNNEKNVQEKSNIMNDLTDNLEKIYHHGRRADNIVTNMLAHSRVSNTTKTDCNINKIINDALALSVVNEKSKNPSFNCEVETRLESSLPLVSLVLQDFSLVILNIIYNAFYSVNKKQKETTKKYNPHVTVMTKKVRNNVIISIKDNGLGVPDHIKEKIFEPFFTTKPSGEGTGLGLSLSYDIITNGHTGTIELNSSPEEETEFLVCVPV